MGIQSAERTLLGHVGIMDNDMATTIVYWVYIGIMEKKMETTNKPGS